MKALSVKELSYSYNKKEPLFENLSFDLDAGKLLCILGPNGSGKTTLIRQVLFPEKENSQRIELFGKKCSELSVSEKSKLVGYVPQKIISSNISVLQTVVMGRMAYKNVIRSKPVDEDYAEAYKALRQMGIEHLSERQLGSISGGEVQRVFIAQSIVKNAKLYVFDEPMAALDPEYQSGFLKLIKWLSENGKTVIFSTHNPNHLFSLPEAEAALIDSSHKLHRFGCVSPGLFGETERIYNHSMSIKKDENGEVFAVFNLERGE